MGQSEVYPLGGFNRQDAKAADNLSILASSASWRFLSRAALVRRFFLYMGRNPARTSGFSY
jgi:hypothetical protein